MTTLVRAGSTPVNLEVSGRILDEIWTPGGFPAGAAQAGQAATTASTSRYGITSRANFFTPSGVGDRPLVIHNGLVAADVSANGLQATLDMTELSVPLPLAQGVALPGIGALTPLYRWRFLVALSAAGGTLGLETGVIGQVSANGLPTHPAFGGQGFGFVGNGAGGWQFIARAVAAGPLTIQQAVTWPGAVTEWAELELRMTPADDTAAAVLEAFVAAERILTVSWASGLLPDYSAIASAVRIRPVVQCISAGLGANLRLGAVRCQYGELAPAGA